MNAEHLSDLRIDMWLAHDLPPADEESARQHVAGCAVCAARLAQIEAARAAGTGAPGFEAIRQAAAQAAPRASRVWRPLWPLLAGAGAAVAIVMMFVVRTPSTTRTKGGARLDFYVKHGDSVRRGGPDEPVSPGDLVRFTYSTAEPLYLAVVGRDAAGEVTVYFPADGAMPALPAGRDVELPRSTVLDETLGAEQVFAYFCKHPIDITAVRRDLRVDSACQVDRVTWVKIR